MRAWEHSKETSRILRGSPDYWETYLPIHELIDSTQNAHPYSTHRYLLHNRDFGLVILKHSFKTPKLDAILHQHISADLKEVPTISQWLALMNITLLPRPLGKHLSPREAGEKLASDMKLLNADFIIEIAELLNLPENLAPNVNPIASRLAMRHSLAPYLIEKSVGVGQEVFDRNGDKVFVGSRDIAEQLIVNDLCSIPPFSIVASSIRLESWM